MPGKDLLEVRQQQHRPISPVSNSERVRRRVASVVRPSGANLEDALVGPGNCVRRDRKDRQREREKVRIAMAYGDKTKWRARADFRGLDSLPLL